jgi:hypothetical protein
MGAGLNLGVRSSAFLLAAPAVEQDFSYPPKRQFISKAALRSAEPSDRIFHGGAGSFIDFIYSRKGRANDE